MPQGVTPTSKPQWKPALSPEQLEQVRAAIGEQPEMNIDHLVFIDENSIDTGMTRLCGRGASNERVVDHTPYSPDLSPIEMMRSKMKAYLRKVKARTGELLETAIADALNLISVSDMLGWFAKNG